jgi:hypothetical protein
MLKFILIVFIIGYVFIKGLGFFFKTIVGGSSMNRTGNDTSSQRKPTGGNVSVDIMPEDNKISKKDFRGGEYVDFEEVK